jgi:hypothetical protein
VHDPPGQTQVAVQTGCAALGTDTVSPALVQLAANSLKRKYLKRCPSHMPCCWRATKRGTSSCCPATLTCTAFTVLVALEAAWPIKSVRMAKNASWNARVSLPSKYLPWPSAAARRMAPVCGPMPMK